MPHQAELVSRVPAGGDMFLVTLRGPAELHASHVRPGQYTEIDLGGERAFFVIASRAGAAEWELVLRGGGASADTLLALPVGARVPIAPALGHGFPCEESRGRPLLMAVNGSGIAAARPVLAARIDDGDAARTEVLVGAKSRAELALAAERATWTQAGVGVTVCLWKDDGAPPPMEPGYVQDVAERRAPALAKRMSRGMIFAVGAGAMVEAMRALAPRLGIAPSDVRTNY